MTSHDIVPFTFGDTTIQVAINPTDSKPYFVAKVVAELLEYTRTSDALEHCRNASVLPQLNKINDLAPATKWIPESDLYRLVMHSKKPEAEKFQDWVVEEVLPSIRKTGSYTAHAPKVSLSLLSSEVKAAIEMATMYGLSGNPALLSADMAVATLHGVSPLKLLGQTHLINPHQEKYLIASDIGAMVGMSAQSVNKQLERLGFHTKPVKDWVLTEKGKEFGIYLDTGKKHSNGTMIQQIKWKESILEAAQFTVKQGN